MAACWITLTGSGKFGFVSNTASGNLSSYTISGNGTVTLASAVAASAQGGAPIDSALSDDSAFLYVVDSSLGRILSYQVHGASLTPLAITSGLDFVAAREEDREILMKHLDARLAGERTKFPLPMTQFRELKIVWEGSTLHFGDEIWPQKEAKTKRSTKIKIEVKSSALLILQPPGTTDS